jgi:ADP-heptose:LPS heptosyltransferase
VPLVPGLREAFALTAEATVLLSPDTSLPHAASALGVPSVVLMRAENAVYAPYRARGHVLVRDTLAALAPSDVADAVTRFLAPAARGAAPAVQSAQPGSTA